MTTNEPILHLPLRVDERGSIYDVHGKSVADTWCLESEKPDASNDERHAIEDARAAEIVRRVNLHDELVEVLRNLIERPKTMADEMAVASARSAALRLLAKVEVRQ